MNPFELFKQDTDEVIMLLNFYIQKSETTPHATGAPRGNNSRGEPERIRVNDKTATNGWF